MQQQSRFFSAVTADSGTRVHLVDRTSQSIALCSLSRVYYKPNGGDEAPATCADCLRIAAQMDRAFPSPL